MEELKERATRLIEEMDRMLTEAGISHRCLENVLGYKQIFIPDCDWTDRWLYSIICHPDWCGFPDKLELNYGINEEGVVEVEGWLSPEEVMSKIAQPKELLKKRQEEIEKKRLKKELPGGRIFIMDF